MQQLILFRNIRIWIIKVICELWASNLGLNDQNASSFAGVGIWISIEFAQEILEAFLFLLLTIVICF